MKKLLLLAGMVAVPMMAASAQTAWTFKSVFPDTLGATAAQRAFITKANDQPHGLVVTPNGNVWVQGYYSRSGESIVTPSGSVNVNVVYVFQPNGTPASFSPINFITFPDGSVDTLGGSTGPNATGVRVFSNAGKSAGRGLAVDGQGNVVIAQGTHIYRVNGTTGAGIARINTAVYGVSNLAGPGATGDGGVFATGVAGGGPIVQLRPDMTLRENVSATSPSFTRAMLGSRTGDTLYVPYYTMRVVLRYIRPDEFSGFSAPDTLLRGFAAESITRDPSTQRIWVSAGSPNDKNTVDNINDNTWYAFDPAALSPGSTPVPLDSIKWSRPATEGRPRGIAFSPDGKLAYVAQFSNPAGEPLALHIYEPKPVASEDDSRWAPVGFDLEAVAPNPVRSSARLRFSLHMSTEASVRVYDLLGRQVMTLVEGQRAAGDNEVVFDASSLATGAYLVRLEADGYVLSQRLNVVR